MVGRFAGNEYYQSEISISIRSFVRSEAALVFGCPEFVGVRVVLVASIEQTTSSAFVGLVFSCCCLFYFWLLLRL